MAPTDDNDAQRRAYFRLHYPQTERPSLLTEGANYPVSEISEGGLRLVALDASQELEQQRHLVGILQLSGQSVAVEGRVLRRQHDEVVVVLSDGVPLPLVMSEQRRLIRKYPALFGRN